MKFSVATPLYNGMPKIRQCIGSVRNQLVSKEAEVKRAERGGQRAESREQRSGSRVQESEANEGIEIEHILQDGGSTDGSVGFLHDFKPQPTSDNSKLPSVPPAQQLDDYQLRFASEPDNGMYDAINKAWAKADGDILSWLNHDEQYLPGTLRKVASFFEEHPEIDIVFGNMIVVAPDGMPLAARREIPLRGFYVRNDFLYAISCATFFRRRLLDDGLLVFDTAYKAAGDMDLIMKLLSANRKVAHIPDYLALFGVDGGNLTVLLGTTMADETREIQLKYGGFRCAPLRKAVKGIRFLERALKGCYRNVDVSYTYVENEHGDSRKVTEGSLGFRFTYERVEKKMKSND